MTNATIVHELDTVKHKLGENEKWGEKERKIGIFFGLVVIMKRIASAIKQVPSHER